MLTAIYVILLIVLLPPVIGLLLLYIAPKPLLNFVKAKANENWMQLLIMPSAIIPNQASYRLEKNTTMLK